MKATEAAVFSFCHTTAFAAYYTYLSKSGKPMQCALWHPRLFGVHAR